MARAKKEFAWIRANVLKNFPKTVKKAQSLILMATTSIEERLMVLLLKKMEINLQMNLLFPIITILPPNIMHTLM